MQLASSFTAPPLGALAPSVPPQPRGEPGPIGQVPSRDELVRLIQTHDPRLRAICRRLCGAEDDLDEVLQDTYVEIIRHLGGFRGESSFLTWATAVARSQLYRQRRRRRRYTVRDDAIDLAAKSFPELLGQSGPDPEDEASNEHLRAILRTAMAELASLDREVFILRQLEGMTAPEVAGTLGLTVPAVKSRLHRARQQLRSLLTDHAGLVEH